MADLGDFVLEQWKLAMRQANGDAEGVASILATSLAFAAVEGRLDIDEVISRVRDDFETGRKAQAQTLRETQ